MIFGDFYVSSKLVNYIKRFLLYSKLQETTGVHALLHLNARLGFISILVKCQVHQLLL